MKPQARAHYAPSPHFVIDGNNASNDRTILNEFKLLSSPRTKLGYPITFRLPLQHLGRALRGPGTQDPETSVASALFLLILQWALGTKRQPKATSRLCKVVRNSSSPHLWPLRLRPFSAVRTRPCPAPCWLHSGGRFSHLTTAPLRVSTNRAQESRLSKELLWRIKTWATMRSGRSGAGKSQLGLEKDCIAKRRGDRADARVRTVTT